MIIDILFAITILLAIYKGWSKGFLVGVFSLLALILGLAAAIRLSAGAAGYLQDKTEHASILWPVVAFIVIFIGVAFLVKLLAKILQKLLQTVLLGWLNRLLGILIYILAYAIIFSVFLWFADQLQLLSLDMKESSVVYNRIAILGPKAVNDITGWIPWFKDLFIKLQDFFGQISPFSGKGA